MPTVLRLGPYRFFFFAGDRDKPEHVHVERDDCVAKFWLDPVRVERAGGFRPAEVRRLARLVGERARNSAGAGMSTSTRESRAARATTIRVARGELIVDLADGRTLAVPIDWFPRLLQGSARERSNWRLIGSGIGIHWPDLDEDLSVEGLLAGRRSGESPASLARWMSKRSRRSKSVSPVATRRRSRRS